METQKKYFKLDLNLSLKDETPELTEIKQIVELYSSKAIDEETRKQNIVFIRAIYYRLARTLTLESLNSIGRVLNKNHATVLHGLKIFPSVYKIKKYKNLYLKCYENLQNKSTLTEAEIESDIIINRYKQKVSELEEDVERMARNLNNDVIKKLLTLDSQELQVFDDTRLKPFLKMRYAQV